MSERGTASRKVDECHATVHGRTWFVVCVVGRAVGVFWCRRLWGFVVVRVVW